MSDDGYHYMWGLPGLQLLPPAGPWLHVSGGNLPFPVAVRFHRAGGRYVFTGLMIGDEHEPREITSGALRRIRLGEILAGMFEDFLDPASPPPFPFPEFPAAVRAVADANPEAGGQRRGPDDNALREFARTYQTELARQPRRAMSTAARAHKISRATANRWAARCRQLGYLPAS